MSDETNSQHDAIRSHEYGLAIPEQAPDTYGSSRALGSLGVAIMERAAVGDRTSLLDAYRFTGEERREIARIIGEAQNDPRVHEANAALHYMEVVDGEHADFAREVFIHQQDVAEVAVGIGLRLGFSHAWLHAYAFAGLTHDLDKGNPNTASVFMKRGIWDYEERQRAEDHPIAAEKRLRQLGFHAPVLYLVGQHHAYLLPNPGRNITGGYGGSTVKPPEQESADWDHKARLFSMADTVVALARKRVYKDGMPMGEAIERSSSEMNVPGAIIAAFRDALAAETAAR